MGTSSDPRLSKKVGRFYCGRFAVRTLRIQDATDRMTAWLSDPEALEVLNVPARRLTKMELANHIRGFDQRQHLLGGIFDRSNNMLVGILQLDMRVPASLPRVRAPQSGIRCYPGLQSFQYQHRLGG